MNVCIKLVGALLCASYSGFVDGFVGISQRHLPSVSKILSPVCVDCDGPTTQYRTLRESVRSPSIQSDEKTFQVKANEAALSPFKAAITKAGMISFVASMCVALPVTLLPVQALYRGKLISKLTKEQYSLKIGQFCTRWLMRIIPFAKIRIIRNEEDESKKPNPAVWVCNHTSMLDIFLLLAVDKRLRGKNKRPIKIIYWKDLEKNPVTKLLFTMCGFISVEMEDNGSGNDNAYKPSSFRSLLKDTKKAFEEGFDIGILPEGQLNVCPENGLQPVFPGAFTLARMSRRPIRMLGIHGLHKLWHGDDSIGMTVTGRDVSVRSYPNEVNFETADQFVDTFSNVVGNFGAKGRDLPNWKEWLNGSGSGRRE